MLIIFNIVNLRFDILQLMIMDYSIHTEKFRL